MVNAWFKRVKLSKLQDDDRMNQMVQELQQEPDSISDLIFDFRDDLDGDPEVALPLSHWDPLLKQLEIREVLEKVRVSGTPKRSLVPLFRYRFFQSLRRIPYLRSLHLQDIDCSSDIVNGIVSYLDESTHLENLTLRSCVDDGHASAISAAMKRNKSIQSLNLTFMQDKFLSALFQSLSSDGCVSQLKHLIYLPSVTASASVAKFLQRYLTNSATTIECFELRGFPTFSIAGFSSIVHGLIQSKSVRKVSFKNVCEESAPQHIANLIQSKANLSTLELLNTAPLRFSLTLAEVLSQHKSTLEHLIIRNVDPDMEHCYQALLYAIPSFKITKLTISFRKDVNENLLLETLKKNYKVQNVYCESGQSEINCLSIVGQARLEFYLGRNRKLAQWVANPKTVPRLLWPEAMKLSLDAGEDSLYLSLQALSGHAIGIERGRRKRKCPPYYNATL